MIAKVINGYCKDFSGADFSGTDLRGSTFTGADLTGADFSGADLTGVSFYGATLTGAKIDGACVYDADFRDAALSRVRLNADTYGWTYPQTLAGWSAGAKRKINKALRNSCALKVSGGRYVRA